MVQMQVALIDDRPTRFVAVPVQPAFGEKARVDQQDFIDRLAHAAERSGLPRVVVPVWKKGNGRLGYRAPLALHPYLRQLTFEQISRLAIKTLGG